MKKEPVHVVIGNELVRAAHGLSLMEKRVLMLAITKLDSTAPALPANLVSRITVKELITQYDIDEKIAYSQAKAAIESLMSRYIRVKNNGIESRMQWAGQSNYKSNEGWLEIEFWHRLAPMLFELKNHFTAYKLSRVSGMKSVYSWRLFELLMQFKRTGLLNIPIDDFYHAMDAPESLRANFSNLRNRVIEPAVKEIREKDGLLVEWEAIKAGRKVKALKFTFPTEQPLKLDTEPKSEPRAKSATKPAPVSPKTEPSVLSLAEIKSRLESARALAALANTSIETYLTERDRTAIKYHQLTI